jgi:hypothetical protein
MRQLWGTQQLPKEASVPSSPMDSAAPSQVTLCPHQQQHGSFLFLFCFSETRSHCVAQAGLELKTFLCPLSECQDYRRGPLCPDAACIIFALLCEPFYLMGFGIDFFQKQKKKANSR